MVVPIIYLLQTLVIHPPSHAHYTDKSWQNSLNHNNAVTPAFLTHTQSFSLSNNSDIYCSHKVHSRSKMERKQQQQTKTKTTEKQKRTLHFILNRLGIILDSAPIVIFCLLKLKDRRSVELLAFIRPMVYWITRQ